ncbi:hypothetical protein SCHPADRAFT_910070 [Schizopora paradoxa]|uniref:F-box domain-containing protein n=1 Tax=Schizopora paradoxa TaxID=27342 RepID=A0A0H2R4J3_9AGAM|nr:hypothetical protein SCHPADRAFT_910070 [Schizopora paradoxa]
MPSEIIIPIVKYKVAMEYGGSLPIAVVPISHVCRSLRNAVLSYPAFWTRVSNRLSQGLQSACLERSGDALIHVGVQCNDRDRPATDWMHRIIWTLEHTIPQSHRWASFYASFCAVGVVKHDRNDFLYAKNLLRSRIYAPNLHSIHIRYSPFPKKKYIDDEGGCGDFYLNWKAPALRTLVASHYFPHPAIAPTINKLQLRSTEFNERLLRETLPLASSLTELHVFYFRYSRNAREGYYRDYNLIVNASPVALPRIRKLTVTLDTNHDAFHPLDQIFSFPNLEEMTVILGMACKQSVTAQTLLRQMGVAISGPVDTVRLLLKDDGEGGSETPCESLGRTIFSIKCRRLEIVGACWDTMVVPENELDTGLPTFRTLEEVKLVQCDEKMIQLVRDIGSATQFANIKAIRAIDCTSSLEEMLAHEVPTEKLEMSRSVVFGECSSKALGRIEEWVPFGYYDPSDLLKNMF